MRHILITLPDESNLSLEEIANYLNNITTVLSIKPLVNVGEVIPMYFELTQP